jgi:hypothetical protein
MAPRWATTATPAAGMRGPASRAGTSRQALTAAVLGSAGAVAEDARRARLTIRLKRAGVNPGSRPTPATSDGNRLSGGIRQLRPRRGATATGADPPCPAFLVATARLRLGSPEAMHGARYTRSYSERCCGIPASRARTSVSLYRRWPPSVRMDVSLPALAQRVTVFGSTRNIVATSAGVKSGSASGVRADMCTASPPGPALRSCFGYPWLRWKPAVDVPYGLLEPYCHHQP